MPTARSTDEDELAPATAPQSDIQTLADLATALKAAGADVGVTVIDAEGLAYRLPDGATLEPLDDNSRLVAEIEAAREEVRRLEAEGEEAYVEIDNSDVYLESPDEADPRGKFSHHRRHLHAHATRRRPDPQREAFMRQRDIMALESMERCTDGFAMGADVYVSQEWGRRSAHDAHLGMDRAN